MSASRPPLAVAALGVAGLLAAGIAGADPAASEDSAWALEPHEPDPALTDPEVRRGHEVFHQRCAACHAGIPGETFGPPFLPPMAGTQALRTRYEGTVPAVLDERTNLTPELIETVVRDGLRSMPFFRPTELSDEDLAALIAYLTRERDAAGD